MSTHIQFVNVSSNIAFSGISCVYIFRNPLHNNYKLTYCVKKELPWALHLNV